MTLDELHFDERGLIPAIVQEAATGELLMVAWMNRVALDATLATGRSHFWSRSRETLWQKGESSGHVQHVDGVYVDCDADTLLVQVHQEGPACHTGHRTCFFRRIVETERVSASLRGWAVSDARDVVAGAAPAVDEAAAAAQMLERLDRIVAQRKASPPAGSYVAGLLAKGEAAICRKIGEEATEVITAALGGEGDRRLVEEMADLWFHTLVLLGQRGLSARDVLEELARRHATRAAAAG